LADFRAIETPSAIAADLYQKSQGTRKGTKKAKARQGPGSTGEAFAARTLVEAAEQPDDQDDRKGNADQPQKKSSTHLHPPKRSPSLSTSLFTSSLVTSLGQANAGICRWFRSACSDVPETIRITRRYSSRTQGGVRMRKLVIGMMAAGTLVAAAPAMAQVHFEGPGVGVRVGPEPRYRDRDYDRWDRSAYRSYGYRDRDRGCRSVTVRERLPDGSTVVRTRERC
jgi:hypothetical protein